VSIGGLDALAAAIGADRIETGSDQLDARRHDYWALSHVRDFVGSPAPRPGALVRPRTVAEVQAVLRFANERRVAVIPFGLGSGVVGGVIAAPDAIVLDMGAMNAVRFIDPVNLLAGFDAGHNGLAAEQAVAAEGLTIGHWPQSVAVSSVGGWVATRASGQFSTGYGNIEDIVHTIEAVLPTGELVTLGKGSTVNRGCVVQTHLFHDRIMRMDTVVLGDGATLGPHCVVLPAAKLGAGATVGPASLVMRGDEVPPSTRWQGNPIVPWNASRKKGRGTKPPDSGVEETAA